MATIEELRANFTATFGSMTRGIREVRKELQGIGDTTQSATQKANNQISKQQTVWQKMNNTLNDVKHRYQTVQNAGGTMARTFGIATAAVGGSLAAATKTAMDFDAQMSKVGATSGANRGEFGRLKKSAIDLGAATSLSAGQAAVAMNEMAKNGFNANQIIKAMPGVISAAESSGEGLALVSDTVSTAINAFGLRASDASHIADVLAQSANNSAAGMLDMSYTFKYAAAPAHALGYSMEELSAATMIMANSGIRGEQAGTTLRAALLRLVNPPKDAAKELKNLGVSITDSRGKMRPFSAIIGDLGKKTDGMSKAQKTAALSTIFSTEAVSGMLPVVESGADKLNKMTRELQNSDGASAKTAKQMKDNLKGSVDQLRGSLESAAITIGEKLSPTIRAMADRVREAIDWFNNLSPEMQQFIVKASATITAVLAVGTAFGAMTWAIGGGVKSIASVIQIGGKLITHLRGVQVAAGAAGAAGGLANTASKAGLLAGVLPMLTNPIGLTITALAALGIGAGAVWHHFNKIESTSTSAADAIGRQRERITPLINQYDALKSQSRLTSDEFGRFVDIQARLKKETSQKEIARLKDEADQLQKKSGLSNTELQKMIDLNNSLVKTVPGATDRMTDQGNRIADNTAKAKAYNAALLEQQIRELEIARNNAVGNEAKYKREINKLQDQLNTGLSVERTYQKLVNEATTNGWKETVKKYEAQRNNVNASEGERALATVNLSLLRNHGETLFRNLGKQQQINDKTQEKLNKDKEQLNRADQLNAKLTTTILKANGINGSGRKGLTVLAQQVQKQQEQLHKMDQLHASGRISTKEYNRGKNEIQGQINKLMGVGNKIKGATNGAYDLNKELRKNINKKVDSHTKVDGQYRALNDTVGKRVNVRVSKPQSYYDLYKTVYKDMFVRVHQNRLHSALYANGTDDHPGGPAVLGDAYKEEPYMTPEGNIGISPDEPTLFNLPKGTKVWSSVQRFINAIPKYARGTRGLINGISDQVNRFNRFRMQPISPHLLPAIPSVSPISNRSTATNEIRKEQPISINFYGDQHFEYQTDEDEFSSNLANRIKAVNYRKGERSDD